VEIFVGTSGWAYSWNLGGSLEWYVRSSGLNAVELNASFYRIPAERQVRRWALVGRELRWAVKVHRSVTHSGRLSEKALDALRRFLSAFEPMDGLIDFYLFQMPPAFVKSEENAARVERVASLLGGRAAFEFRHPSWFSDETVSWAERTGFTPVSVDSPNATWIVAVRGTVYLRMHGRSAWYSHNYSEGELREVAERLAALRPRRVYVFFNNDHAMLDNARAMMRVLRELAGRA
jgi:uncharacterized protein YecE (DUF72 family)